MRAARAWRRRRRAHWRATAWTKAPSAAAGGLEALHVLERDVELVGLDLDLRRKELGDFVERRRQVTVVIEGIDQRGDDLAIAKREIEKRELTVQMIAKRRRRDLLRQEIVVLARVAAAPVAVSAAAAAVVGEVRHIGCVIARVTQLRRRITRRDLVAAIGAVADASRARERHFRRCAIVLDLRTL